MAQYCDNFNFRDNDNDSFEFWNGLRGPAGPAGAPGAPGTSVELRGPVASTSELPESAPSSELWMVGEESPYDGYFWNGSAWINAGQLMQGPQGEPGEDGADGVTFTPTVSSAGVISWTNDGGLPNPESVNIKGPAGQDGTNGQDGAPGAAAGFGVPTATVDGNVGTPSVTVTASGPDTAKVFAFAFSNLKGEPGSGGGGPDPYTSDPADLAAAASPGSASQYARGDHVHKLPSAADVGAQATITATGILKGAGSGSVGAAAAGTDYQAAITASGILKGAGGGSVSAATAGTDYQAAITASGILKGAGGGSVSAATAGTDYQAAITASGMLKGNGSGSVSAATAGTDYQAPLTAMTDYQTPVHVASITLAAADWTGSGPYTQTVTISGATITANTKVDLQPDATALAQLISDSVAALFVSNTSGTLTATAIGAAPTANLTIQVSYYETA